MKNLKFLRQYVFVSSVLLVSFLSLLILCRLEVHASSPVPNSDYTYDIYYKNDQGAWVSMTANGGVSGLTPNRAYDCRIRINLDSLVGSERPSNLKLKFNHTKGASTDYRVFLQQADGVYISTPTYSTLLVNHSSSNTVTTVQVFGIESPNYDYLYINFTFALDSYNTTSDPTNGIISIGVTSFTMEDLTLEQQMNIINETINNNGTVINNSINNMNNNLHNDLNSLTEQESRNTSSIINNQNEHASQAHSDAQTAHTDSVNILTGVGNIFSSIGDLISDFGDFVVSLPGLLWDAITDALQWLFVPDLDDIQSDIEQSIEDWREEAPLLASLMSIFDNIISTINSGVVNNSFTVPSFTIPLPDNVNWTFDSITVPLFPSGLNDLLIPTRNFIGIITSILLLRFMFFKIFSALGFDGRDNISEIDDRGD